MKRNLLNGLLLLFVCLLLLFCSACSTLPVATEETADPPSSEPLSSLPEPESTPSPSHDSTEQPSSTQPSESLPAESAPPTEGTSQAPDETAPPQPSENTPTPTTPPETTDPGTALQGQIDALIARAYELRSYYTGQLAALEASALAEYHSLAPESRTSEAAQSIALRYMDIAYAMEDTCDGQMDALCQELGILLLESNGDLNLINDIRYAYAQEKQAAKSHFLSEYMGYIG